MSRTLLLFDVVNLSATYTGNLLKLILKLYKSKTLHALAWKETWEWQPIRLSTSKAKTIQPFHLCLQ